MCQFVAFAKKVLQFSVTIQPNNGCWVTSFCQPLILYQQIQLAQLVTKEYFVLHT